MNVLINTKVVLDALVSERRFHQKAIACLDVVKGVGAAQFMSATSIGRVVRELTQHVKCEGDSVAKLRAFLKCYEIQILSATGQEFSSLESCAHIEEALSSIAARRRDKYNVDHIGYNSRLDTLQAALLAVRLRYIDRFNEKRRAVADLYNDGLRALHAIQPPQCLDSAHHVYHQYTIQITDGTRDSLQAYLKRHGIGSMVYYPVPLHQMRVFAGRHIAAGPLESAERLCDQVLSLPIGPLMHRARIERVAACIGDKVNEASSC